MFLQGQITYCESLPADIETAILHNCLSSTCGINWHQTVAICDHEEMYDLQAEQGLLDNIVYDFYFSLDQI